VLGDQDEGRVVVLEIENGHEGVALVVVSG